MPLFNMKLISNAINSAKLGQLLNNENKRPTKHDAFYQ